MSQPLAILVVEDDDALRDAVCLTLTLAGHEAIGANGGESALKLLTDRHFSLVISDLRMQPIDGLELLAKVRARLPKMPVLLMTAYGDVDKAVAAMRGGACDFLMKPFEPEVLLAHVHRYAAPPLPIEDLVAQDPRTRELLSIAARVAETDATVLLTGESGTGKEVFARYLHQCSPRRQSPFIAINCAAIPESLLEATLFGHEKGSYTGAQSAHAGKFEQAQGGTILLDEISEMPLGLQAKLLRVLQEREVERVGARKSVALDIRVLATSNRDMHAEVAGGRFREDLYYRLNVFPLMIPALRERPGDIVPLAGLFIARHARHIGRHARLDPAAESLLRAHRWPGNVRELENTMQRALILAPGDTITAHTLAHCLPQSETHGMPPVAELAANHAAASHSETEPANIKVLEREHILHTLRALGGSRKRAVAKLGISERTLRYKIAQYRAEGYDI